MRSATVLLLVCWLTLLVPIGCIDSLDQTLRQRLDILVVEGSITNLAEPQLVRLSRAQSEPLTGLSATFPLTGVRVEIRIDSVQVVVLRETAAGRYQAPDDFMGQVGHRYQLCFTLPDGTTYRSEEEIMPAVPAFRNVRTQFNPASLPVEIYHGTANQYRGSNDFFVDWQDPADQHNYYRWDWKLWEKQDWCRTCQQGFYLITSPISSTLDEGCYSDDLPVPYYVHDYACRGSCWEIIRNLDLNLYEDRLSNGNLIQRYQVAQIPYYSETGCLVEIRQSSLSPKAYRYYRLDQAQTQQTGGLADGPPTALIGNVRNMANRTEAVVGYFTASAVATVRYWLDRKQNGGNSPGLFLGMSGLKPSPEDLATDPNTGRVKRAPLRPTPTAVCVESDTRTPNKPAGWQD